MRGLDLQEITSIILPDDDEGDTANERGEFLIVALSTEGRALALPVNLN